MEVESIVSISSEVKIYKESTKVPLKMNGDLDGWLRNVL